MNLANDVILGYELDWKDYCYDHGIEDPYKIDDTILIRNKYSIDSRALDNARSRAEHLEEYDRQHGRYIARCIYNDFGREALMLTEWARWAEDDWRSCLSKAGQCNMMCPYYNGGRCEWKGLE